MNIHDNSKNKILKIDFTFDSAHYISFMKMGAKLKGRFAYPHLGQVRAWYWPNKKSTDILTICSRYC